MPVFNGEKYLELAIKSIINQSYGNFEFLILNDGSTDSSQEIIDRFAANDNRLRTISRENRGIVASLNELVAWAAGDYIARMDCDDVAYPDRLERQLSFLIENQLDVCGSQVNCTSIHRFRRLKPTKHNELIFHSLYDTPFWHPTVLSKSSVLKENLYGEEFTNAEDYGLWVDLIIKGFRLGNYPEPLLDYRFHEGQLSSINNTKINSDVSSIRKKIWRHCLKNLYGIEQTSACYQSSVNASEIKKIKMTIEHVLKNGNKASFLPKPYIPTAVRMTLAQLRNKIL